MKFYLLFMVVILAAGQVKSDMKLDLSKVDMACREETQVSENEIKRFFQNDMKEPKEAIKCHLKCYMEKYGQWKNGAFDEEAAKKFLHNIAATEDEKDVINKTIDDCKTKKGSSECDTAYLITKCMTEYKAVVM
ncbi:general odorant-binding protein 56h-like [Lucilia sericata]|uniref:general odorant-binding protein 56h-like n=1 Tax=Lucilia sericata TaxID=13632 RepID=UPI0018A87284|nr:general odorant-binding protein 56h-like [Lucilia sericata]